MKGYKAILAAVFIFSTLALSSYLYIIAEISHRNLVREEFHETSSATRQIENVSHQPSRISKPLFEQFGLENLTMLRKLENPRPYFEFLMTPWRVTAEHPSWLKNKVVNTSMIIVIKSDYKRTREREVVRRSWGSIRYFDGFRIEVVFAVAKAANVDGELAIQRENALHGDMLQVDIEERYESIGLKALAGMQWVWQRFPEDWIYSSGDDDVLPDLRKLRNVIEGLKQNTTKTYGASNNNPYFPMLCSVRYKEGEVPIRDKGSKWVVTRETYPYDVYPPFCLGGFYSMPVKLSSGIFAVSRHYPYYRMDDVWLTGFMRLKLCDVYNAKDFVFDKTDPKCAISNIRSLDFEHLPKNEDLFIRKWYAIENDSIKNTKELIKG